MNPNKLNNFLSEQYILDGFRKFFQQDSLIFPLSVPSVAVMCKRDLTARGAPEASWHLLYYMPFICADTCLCERTDFFTKIVVLVDRKSVV